MVWNTALLIFPHKKSPLVYSDTGTTIINRVTTQIVRTAWQAGSAPLLSEVSFAWFPLGITQDTPECNSQSMCVPGFHPPPGFLWQGQRLLLSRSTYVSYMITESIVNSKFVVNVPHILFFLKLWVTWQSFLNLNVFLFCYYFFIVIPKQIFICYIGYIWVLEVVWPRTAHTSGSMQI